MECASPTKNRIMNTVMETLAVEYKYCNKESSERSLNQRQKFRRIKETDKLIRRNVEQV